MMDRTALLKRLNMAWTAFKESYADVPAAWLTEPGVAGEWSVKDLLAHVTWWEEEALMHLPLIIAGGQPPRYSVAYGGIDAFNARMWEERRNLPLTNVLTHLDETHRRLVAFLQNVPEEQFRRETRFRRRLRLDTYSHYPIHTKQIRDWREQQSSA